MSVHITSQPATRLLLIDCRTRHLVQYIGRRQQPHLAMLIVPFEDPPAVLKALDWYRLNGLAVQAPA